MSDCETRTNESVLPWLATMAGTATPSCGVAACRTRAGAANQPCIGAVRHTACPSSGEMLLLVPQCSGATATLMCVACLCGWSFGAYVTVRICGAWCRTATTGPRHGHADMCTQSSPKSMAEPSMYMRKDTLGFAAIGTPTRTHTTNTPMLLHDCTMRLAVAAAVLVPWLVRWQLTTPACFRAALSRCLQKSCSQLANGKLRWMPTGASSEALDLHSTVSRYAPKPRCPLVDTLTPPAPLALFERFGVWSRTRRH